MKEKITQDTQAMTTLQTENKELNTAVNERIETIRKLISRNEQLANQQ